MYGNKDLLPKPGWSPIRELATLAGTYTMSVSADLAIFIKKTNKLKQAISRLKYTY